MALYYQETARIPTIGVNDLSCLEFAPNGCLIAGGGLGGTIGVWDTKCRALYLYTGSSPVLSLAWSACESLYAGLQDGSILRLSMTPSDFIVSGWRSLPAHAEPIAVDASPIERIAVNARGRLATTSKGTTTIWHVDNIGTHIRTVKVPAPNITSVPADAEVTVIGLHWTHLGRHECLAILYKYRGMLIVTADNGIPLRIIPPHTGFIGDSALSYDDRCLAVANMSGGFDIYNLISSTWSTIDIANGTNGTARAPVQLVHDGRALLTGSSHGDCRVWSLPSFGHAQLLHTLRTGSNTRITSIAAYEGPCVLAGEPLVRFVAAGFWDGRGFPKIVIWEARGLHESRVFQTTRLQVMYWARQATIRGRQAVNWGRQAVNWGRQVTNRGWYGTMSTILALTFIIQCAIMLAAVVLVGYIVTRDDLIDFAQELFVCIDI